MLPLLQADSAGQRRFTASGRRIEEAVLSLYDGGVDPRLPIRRFYVGSGRVRPLGTVDADGEQLTFFDAGPAQDAADKRDTRIQQAVFEIKRRFGANALLRGTNFQEGSTARERNATVGGHASGEGMTADDG